MSARSTPRRRPRWPLILLGLAVVGVVFLLGVGLGLTLEERPRAGDTRTSVRTFQPPPESATATVNVTVP